MKGSIMSVKTMSGATAEFTISGLHQVFPAGSAMVRVVCKCYGTNQSYNEKSKHNPSKGMHKVKIPNTQVEKHNWQSMHRISLTKSQTPKEQK